MRITKGALIALVVLFTCHCEADSQEIRIDHVVTVVADLDQATSRYTQLGFTVKQGRLHANGLINGHVKFGNKTSLELMSVRGEPTDRMARDYQTLLQEGEGGVYLAVSGVRTEEMEQMLSGLKIAFETSKGRSWDYITFPQEPELAHFFFIAYHGTMNDPGEITTHKNESDRITAAFIEGSERVSYFLKGIGLQSAGRKKDELFGSAERFFTASGDIIVVPKNESAKRPRLKAVSFGSSDGKESVRISF
ncbi:VOC family protein [uncultured Imperialibacter sp.]|uniref:VOC family protein n=1 Tax=uncultured Imperialibacter sp. TaxID=1672639 RepID=UPI0030DA53E3|tara:strand:- start:2393 stop:3142 length:750 start_codon:yes stop_codon:yes gene_type:complete